MCFSKAENLGRFLWSTQYFYCIWQQGLLYDAERDLLAIAKFLVFHQELSVHAILYPVTLCQLKDAASKADMVNNQ